jgi:RNA recognition motif-containing protein
MGSKLYVGGLPYAATESQLTTLFAAHGTVESARVIADKFTGQSRGFGFVEMSTPEEAKAAITALNGSQMDDGDGQRSQAQEPRTGGGGGGGGHSVAAARPFLVQSIRGGAHHCAPPPSPNLRQ